jgi:AmmeMemoRadiSam system protein B
MEIRRSDFAGSWYPGGETECRKAIEELSDRISPCPDTQKGYLGGILPHAGWIFSGRVAFNVIKCLKNSTEPDTIVIFGRHLHPGGANYLMKEGSWSTPLGELEIDKDLGESLSSEFRFKIETASNYEQDNTIEVQLPFIKFLFPHVKILPLGLPPKMASINIGRRTAEIALELGKKILVLGSTDLTHYGYNYGFTPKGTGEAAVEWVKNENDKKIVDLMLDMDSAGIIDESLINYNACCGGAVAAAISSLKVLGAKKGEKIFYTTSYDVRPDSSFVGYVGIVFS